MVCQAPGNSKIRQEVNPDRRIMVDLHLPDQPEQRKK